MSSLSQTSFAHPHVPYYKDTKYIRKNKANLSDVLPRTPLNTFSLTENFRNQKLTRQSTGLMIVHTFSQIDLSYEDRAEQELLGSDRVHSAGIQNRSRYTDSLILILPADLHGHCGGKYQHDNCH